MPVRSLNDFHHWLLSARPSQSPFILLHPCLGGPLQCAAAVARHLNEFDEASGAPWIAPAPELVHQIAADPSQRRLLGVDDPCPQCPPTSACGIRKVLTALARRGHVILDHPLAFQATAELPLGFRAALGIPEKNLDAYHVVFNPHCFHARCLAPLVADCFLEWEAGVAAESPLQTACLTPPPTAANG